MSRISSGSEALIGVSRSVTIQDFPETHLDGSFRRDEAKPIEGSMASIRIRPEQMWVCLWRDEKGLKYMES